MLSRTWDVVEFLVTQFLKWVVVALDTSLYRGTWKCVPAWVVTGTGDLHGFAAGQQAEESVGAQVLSLNSLIRALRRDGVVVFSLDSLLSTLWVLEEAPILEVP